MAVVGGTASAGGFHVRIGGHAHVGIRVPHVHWNWSRPHYNSGATIRVHGGIWLGGAAYGGYYYNPGFAEPPPPPPPPCDCGTGYAPVYPGSQTYAAPAAAPQAPLPRLGIGLFAGGVTADNGSESTDVGLLGRFRLTPGLILEGEIGKSETSDGLRVDRRGEGALIWEIGAERPWAPYLLAGFGATRADTADTAATQGFGELGVGLRWAVTPRLHLTADFRAGSRDTVSGGKDVQSGGVLAKSVAPPTASGDSEEYTRVRFSGLVYF
ncbi:MAG: hypothetical protein K8W52_11440 [Deltaproteobacteria bacterium]|nr:hypothetical protein [Deltaproteobacteria bacterium]